MTAAESAGRRPDVPALTGLRFLAAFSVLLAHGVAATVTNNEPPQGAVLWLMQSSGFGMTLFFVLSGFVIHYNYARLVTDGRLRGIAAFFWARFARLYPLFLLMMLVYVLVSQRHVAYWTGHPEKINAIFQALPYFLLSIQSWIYKLIDGGCADRCHSRRLAADVVDLYRMVFLLRLSAHRLAHSACPRARNNSARCRHMVRVVDRVFDGSLRSHRAD